MFRKISLKYWKVDNMTIHPLKQENIYFEKIIT